IRQRFEPVERLPIFRVRHAFENMDGWKAARDDSKTRLPTHLADREVRRRRRHLKPLSRAGRRGIAARYTDPRHSRRAFARARIYRRTAAHRWVCAPSRRRRWCLEAAAAGLYRCPLDKRGVRECRVEALDAVPYAI